MATISTNSGRALYDSGQSLPGTVVNNDNGEVIKAGYVAAALPFGRFVAPFVLQADGKTKLFSALDETDTASDGATVFSNDAVSNIANLQYSANEACGVMSKGFIVVEAAEDLVLDNTALTIVNGEASGQDDEVGMIAQSTGTGYSTTTNIRLVEKISASLAVVEITGPITLAAG